MADADTHGCDRVTGTAVGELESSGQSQPGTTHPQRMTQGDRAAVGVDVLGVVRQAQLTQDGKRLRGERLVQLDDVDVVDPPAGPVE